MALQSLVTGMSHRKAVLAVALSLVAGFSAGCVTTDVKGPDVVTAKKPARCKGQQPTQVVTRWEKEVAFAPDPTRGGAPIPGIIGRVYLFGPKRDVSLEGDGALRVELYDASVQPPKMLEFWELDPASVEKLKKPDFVGVGYSLFLPWSSYRADLTRVQMRVSYKSSRGGDPLFANSGLLKFGSERPVVSSSAYTTGPNGVVQRSPQAQVTNQPVAGQNPSRGAASPAFTTVK